MLISDYLEARMPAPTASPEIVYSTDGTGELTVTFSPVAAVGSVARGATRVPFGELGLSASCDADITISSVTVQHTGQGAASDLSRVYLVDGFRRISRARSFDTRSGLAELRTPSLTIPACGAVRLSLVADVSPDATVASEHAVEFRSPLDVVSSAKSVTLTVSDPGATVRASPVKSGSVTLNFLSVPARLRYGRRETIARLQFSADAEHDYLLKSLTLTNKEDARDMDFTDIKLETRSGTGVSLRAARMDGRELTLIFSPSFVLERSRTVVLLLRANVNVTHYRKVNFELAEPSDFHVTIYRPER